MYYLIEAKDRCYRIVDNISDIKTRESCIYKYCLNNNIQMKEKKEYVRLSGLYCIPKEANIYGVYFAESDGWVYRGRLKELYDLKFVHYLISDGNKYKLNNSVKQYKMITIQNR